MGKTNKVVLIGNFGDEIKMHFFENDNCIGRVSLATTEKYKKQDGTVVENTEWHNLVFRNKVAKVVEKYTEKGSKIYVEGRLKYRSWEDDKGQKRYSTEIHVNEFEFLSVSSKNGNKTISSSPIAQSVDQDEGDYLPFN